MRTYRYGNIDVQWDPSSWDTALEGTDHNGVKFCVPRATGWFAHPMFLECFPEGSFETLGDVLAWLNENYEYFGTQSPDLTMLVSHAGVFRNQGFESEFYLDSRYSEDLPICRIQGFSGSDERVLFEDTNPSRRTIYFHYIHFLADQVLMYSSVVRDDDDEEQYYFDLNNYTFRPHFKRMSLPKEYNPVYLGLELEISTTLSIPEIQAIVMDMEPKQELFFYFKSDSSIGGRYQNLIELVTHPMSSKRMRREFRIFFKKLEKLVEAKGPGAHLGDYFDLSRTLNNGLHIHVDNQAFIPSSGRTQYHQNRFLTVFNQWDSDFQSWLKKITKRPSLPKDNDYCQPHPGMVGYTLARRLKDGQKYSEHHSACHTASYTTEVRVFYGLFNLQHICACIEIVDAVYNFTIDPPLSCLKRKFKETFTDWVLQQPGYRNAKKVLKECV